MYVELLYGEESVNSWKDELDRVEANRKRWNAFLNDEASMSAPYKYKHPTIMGLARKLPPEKIGATVTSFTNWIYRLYIEKPDIEKLSLRRSLEREIIANRVPVPEHSKWKLDYNGTDGADDNILPISSLTVNGQGIRGKPDLVFREKNTGRVLIVEIKISDAYVPSDGWPNLRAQLWAYSKLDLLREAPEIILVGDIWAKTPRLRRARTLSWNASDRTLNSQCAELFELYKNHAAAR
jgi:hypothetical protein